MKSNRQIIYGARSSRKDSTEAEELLWQSIDRFILDFYCPRKKLAIEIDGGIHINRKEYDRIRQEIIESKGIKFLRFKNKDIMKKIDFVLKTIKRKLVPSPRSGEGCPELVEGRGEECL
ncbi:MAG: DUF559 domain-containing protein [Candidatus Margulisiibacteriota bacterium]|nr:DUF559 domain-containing protein [Candidatus Margulisiibacteriota bacterium]